MSKVDVPIPIWCAEEWRLSCLNCCHSLLTDICNASLQDSVGRLSTTISTSCHYDTTFKEMWLRWSGCEGSSCLQSDLHVQDHWQTCVDVSSRRTAFYQSTKSPSPSAFDRDCCFENCRLSAAFFRERKALSYLQIWKPSLDCATIYVAHKCPKKFKISENGCKGISQLEANWKKNSTTLFLPHVL